jgi:hypothetical protein
VTWSPAGPKRGSSEEFLSVGRAVAIPESGARRGTARAMGLGCGSEQVVQHQGLESRDPLEYRIVRHQAGCLGTDCGCGLEGVWGPQTMGGTDSGCDIRDFEVRGDPVEIGIRGKQRVELGDPVLSGVPAGLNQPCEDAIGDSHIARVGFQLVDEDAGRGKAAEGGLGRSMGHGRAITLKILRAGRTRNGCRSKPMSWSRLLICPERDSGRRRER